MSKNQLTGTATQPQCNCKYCQFNKDQYCILERAYVVLLEYHSCQILCSKCLLIHCTVMVLSKLKKITARLQTMSTFLNIANHGEITTTFQFTGIVITLLRYYDDRWRNAPGVFRKAFETFFNFRSLRNSHRNCWSTCRHCTKFFMSIIPLLP